MDPRLGLSTEVFRASFPLIISADDSLRLVRAPTVLLIVDSRLAHGNDLKIDENMTLVKGTFKKHRLDQHEKQGCNMYIIPSGALSMTLTYFKLVSIRQALTKTQPTHNLYKYVGKSKHVYKPLLTVRYSFFPVRVRMFLSV